MRKPLLFLFLGLILTACQSAALNTTPRANRTRTPGAAVSAADTATVNAPPAGSATQTAPPPQPTLDFPAYILTQAYAQFTPVATETPLPAATAGAAPAFAPAQPLATASPYYIAPAVLVTHNPVLIPNAVNTVDCKVNGVGDCTPDIAAGAGVYFTWTFGVKGSNTFQWGSAAVAIERNGQPYKWFQATNGLKPPPNAGDSSALRVGETASFRGGLDNIAPGLYSARLMMCTLSVDQCAAGGGWQDVGGDTVQFAVNP